MRAGFVLLVGCATSDPLDRDEAVVQDDDNDDAIEPYLPDAEPIRSVPVYGGTLESAPGIGGVVAADPEGNSLLRVVGDEVVAIDLGHNARPFRVLVEGTRAWVTLRGTGELAAIGLATSTVEWRSRICLEPRGVARSPAGPLVVACAGGELVELTDDGEILRLTIVDSDLRDVVAMWDDLLVSRFASAEVLLIDPATLTATARTSLGEDAGVAWRMRLQDGRLMVLHQTRPRDLIELEVDVEDTGDDGESSYGADGCSGRTVDTVLTEVLSPGEVQRTTLEGVTLGTDFVVTEPGQVAVADAGAPEDGDGILRFDVHLQRSCATANLDRTVATRGRPSALAIDPEGELLLQSVSPLSIARAEDHGVLLQRRADSSTGDVELFHTATDAGVSCASCHPEGLDDGHVWTFFTQDAPAFARRTMPLAGGILSRLPYHWDAVHEDPDALMADTFVSRMGGSTDPVTTASLFAWLDGLRHVRAHPWAPASAIEIGRAAFTKAGCEGCHSGASFTSNTIESIGRDGVDAVKVPSLLGVGVRDRLLHDGCYVDLHARFVGGCRVWGDTHGSVSRLTSHEIEALEAYVRTL